MSEKLNPLWIVDLKMGIPHSACLQLDGSRGLRTGSREAPASARVQVNFREGVRILPTVKFVNCEEDGAWIGYLQDYPDYWTQGESLDDLKDHLWDLYDDLTSGELAGIRQVDELVVS
jgi:hypothetical protein